MNKRKSGIVIPVSSLPGPYGIGTIGAPARRMIDFLAESGQSYWQMLPLNPTGFADSPYQSCSSFAGNPYLIDLEALCEEGLLTFEELEAFDFGSDPDQVDYGLLYQNRHKTIRIAFERGKTRYTAVREAFSQRNRAWLRDYALYMAIKESFGMAALRHWPDKALLAREKKALDRALEEHAEDVAFHEFVQFLFWSQWADLRDYAAKRGIQMVGDLPIYVSEDSVEVWTQPELFILTAPGVPSMVAGVPPDLYSNEGQLWGNPLYNWEYHAQTGYKWWLSRLRHTQTCFDVIRIDHFRGFYNYWSIKAGAKTAISGRWRKGPGLEFVEKIKTALPPDSLIAEDLGDLDDKVREFFVQTELPGMKVLVYAFDPCQDNPFLPHNIPYNSVAYTSSHDSPPFIGWLMGDASPDERKLAFDYLRLREDEGLGWGALKSIWGSPAKLAMAMFQDVLGIGTDGRINTPATVGGRNWRWRVRSDALNSEVAGRLLNVTKIYKRVAADYEPKTILDPPETPKKRRGNNRELQGEG